MKNDETLLFPLGTVVRTRGVSTQVPESEILLAVAKHSRGNWGNVSRQNWVANDVAVKKQEFIFSVYSYQGKAVFYITTDALRLKTTVLLPSEY